MTIGIDDPMTVTGRVTRIDMSAFGPNSGEMTLVVEPDGALAVVVFAGIMSDNGHATGIEHGPFSAFAQIATMAMATGRQVECTYRVVDKPRLTGLKVIA